jgi:hypothetical protein
MVVWSEWPYARASLAKAIHCRKGTRSGEPVREACRTVSAGVILLAAAAVVMVSTTNFASGSAGCGRSTAKQLIRTLPVAKEAEPYRGLISVICIDFTRDGRKDIVFTVWAAMNHGAHYWAAFRRTNGGKWDQGSVQERLLRRPPSLRRHGHRDRTRGQCDSREAADLPIW